MIPAGPVALLPREVYVDDVIGGCPVVRFTPPEEEPIVVRLTADAAKALAIALGASAAISTITGWGLVDVPGSCVCLRCGGDCRASGCPVLEAEWTEITAAAAARLPLDGPALPVGGVIAVARELVALNRGWDDALVLAAVQERLIERRAARAPT